MSAPSHGSQEPQRAARLDLSACLSAAALLGLVWITYHRVFECGFVNFDDPFYVAENPYLRYGLTWQGICWGLSTLHFSNWHPLVWWSYLLDYQLYGYNAAGFHATNLLWHSVNTLMLFLALRRLTGAAAPSLLVAALFAVHPLNVESVVWVSERKGMISSFFWMLGLWSYAGYVERPGLPRYGLVFLSLALGLMAKQMLVTFPCVLLLLDFWPLQRARRVGWRRLIVEKLPLFVLVAAGCAVAVYAQRRGGSTIPLDVLSFETRLKNAAVSYVLYLGRAAWPVDLCLYYPHPGAGLPLAQAVAAALFLGAVTALAFWLRRVAPHLLVGWLWYLGTLVPVIGLVQVGGQAQANRYAYIPLIGIFIAVSWSLHAAARSWHWERRTASLAALVLLCYMITSWGQVFVWWDSRLLWQQALQVGGENDIALNNLGEALYERGELSEAELYLRRALMFNPKRLDSPIYLAKILLARHNDLDDAERLCRDALRLDPSFPEAHTVLGDVLLERGDMRRAAEQFQEAVRLAPAQFDERTQSLSHNGLGLALLFQGELDKAAEHFQTGLQLNPALPALHANLGQVYQMQGRGQEAFACLHRAVALQPQSARFQRELGYVLYQENCRDEARAAYQESLRLDPHWPESQGAVAWKFATDPDPHLRNGAQALRLAAQRVQALGENAERLDLLAAAYAELGQFKEAAAMARRAAAHAVAAGASEQAQQLTERAAQYERGQPFRSLAASRSLEPG